MKKQVVCLLNKGITLVSLVITIIMMLILAGITTSMLIGDQGIIQRAKEAGKNYQEAAKSEQKQLSNLYKEMENIQENGLDEIKEETFDKPTKVTVEKMDITSYTPLLVPTYGAKKIKISCNPSNDYIFLIGYSSNLGKYFCPAQSGNNNGVVRTELSYNANGKIIDVSNCTYISIHYYVSSSSTTIQNVVLEWFYE